MWRLFEKYVKSQPRSSGSHARQFSYDWLNRTLFPQIITEGKGQFRPQYVWGVTQGVNLAKTLGKKSMTLEELQPGAEIKVEYYPVPRIIREMTVERAGS